MTGQLPITKKKRWMTVEINIVVGFFSSKYGIFYFCPKRT
jgi:hypothetical protein